MKVLVTGVCGQLGHDVMNELIARGHKALGSDIHEKYSGADDGTPVTTAFYKSVDITDSEAVEAAIVSLNPDAVIHCAAWTAVDAAEDEENKTKVMNINAVGTRNIASACAMTNCKMMYISTDYVFSGQGERPWHPDCKDFAPLNFYGVTKLDGEMSVSAMLTKYFIVRIAWVFGKNGNNFIKTMLKVGKGRDEVRVVDDQIGTPTYTYDLARLLVDMIETEKYGFYNATNEGGFISWADFAEKIFEFAGYPTKVTRVTTEEYGESKAKRPFNSRLDKTKLYLEGFKLLPDWEDALGRYLVEIGILDEMPVIEEDYGVEE